MNIEAFIASKHADREAAGQTVWVSTPDGWKRFSFRNAARAAAFERKMAAQGLKTSR